MFRPSFILRHHRRFVSTKQFKKPEALEQEVDSFLLTFVSNYGWPGAVSASIGLASILSFVAVFLGTYSWSHKIDQTNNKIDNNYNELSHKIDQTNNKIDNNFNELKTILLDHRDWMMKSVESQNKQIHKQNKEFAQLHEKFIHSQVPKKDERMV